MKPEQKQKWLAAFEKWDSLELSSHLIGDHDDTILLYHHRTKRERKDGYLAARQDAQGEIDEASEFIQSAAIRNKEIIEKLQAENKELWERLNKFQSLF